MPGIALDAHDTAVSKAPVLTEITLSGRGKQTKR